MSWGNWIGEHRVGIAALVLAFAVASGASAVALHTLHSRKPVGVTVRTTDQDPEAVQQYWTPERQQAAQPLPFPGETP